MSGPGEFVAFPKIPRLRRECVITEKIDGTNAQVYVTEEGGVFAGSRNRWITPESDNAGFAAWVEDHADELREGLGTGHHYGEWWGAGIQRRYAQDIKILSLFNTGRWTPENPPPGCCRTVPVLYAGVFTDDAIADSLTELRERGSVAAPGFMRPEGVVVYHSASRGLYKVLLEGDELPKALAGDALVGA